MANVVRGNFISSLTRGSVGRTLRLVSTRLAILFFAALIPVSILASVLAWENFVFDASVPRMHAMREATALTAANAADERSAREAAENVAAALGTMSGDDCQAVLDVARALDASHLVALAWLEDGRPRCMSGTPPAGTREGSVPSVEVPTAGGGVLQVWTSESVGLARVGAIEDARFWTISEHGLQPLVGASESELPPPRRLAALRAYTVASGTWNDAAGSSRAYAVAPPGASPRLLISLPATRAVDRARAVFGMRIAEILVLLLLGLTAVATMTEYAVTRPLRRLTAAVVRWRIEGVFDPTPTRFMPAELSELRDSFAHASESLVAQERQLRGALARQDLLLHEVHHRVKNNLQIVASLLSLQGSRIQLPEAKAEFGSARDRVRALATVHRHLYAHGELQTINMRGFLAELCGQMFQAAGEVPGQRIALDLEAPELEISSDQAVPLSLLITEAVGNALKHAFPEERSGRISVLMEIRDDTATLTILDDGVGGTTPFDKRRGIGLQLMHGFARQLGASLGSGAASAATGTLYTVAFRLEAPRRHIPGVAAAGPAEAAPP